MTTTELSAGTGTTAAVASSPVARRLALGGIAGAIMAAVLIGGLDVWTLDQPRGSVRRTISEYMLGEYRWFFYLAVLAFAGGILAVLSAMVVRGFARLRSGASVMLGLASLGLVLVVLFEKHDWSVGPSTTGYVHQLSSLLAFVTLPIGAMLLAKPWLRDERWRVWAQWTRWLGAASLTWFAVILAMFVFRFMLDFEWFPRMPLGLVERGLTFTEVLAVLVLGGWASAAAARRATMTA